MKKLWSIILAQKKLLNLIKMIVVLKQIIQVTKIMMVVAENADIQCVVVLQYVMEVFPF